MVLKVPTSLTVKKHSLCLPTLIQNCRMNELELVTLTLPRLSQSLLPVNPQRKRFAPLGLTQCQLFKRSAPNVGFFPKKKLKNILQARQAIIFLRRYNFIKVEPCRVCCLGRFVIGG